MKPALSLLLNATILAAALAPSPTPQPQNESPDVHFRIDLIFDAPFLPIKSTFANIIYFIRKVAHSGFEELLQPLAESSSVYPEIEIESHATTEARFLLWGIYLAATDMVKYTRFNDVAANLYWHDKFVGQISLVVVKTSLRLPGPMINGTGSMMDSGAGLSLDDISNKTTRASAENIIAPPMDNITGGDTAEKALKMISVKAPYITSASPSASPTQFLPNATLSSELSVDFDRVAGAKRLGRNDVFLTFYASLLHVAKYPASDNLRYFNIKIIDLRVHMHDLEDGCLVVLSLSTRPPFDVA